MPSNVEVSINARDNASATLDKVRQQLEMFPTFARNVGAVGPELDKASRGFADFDVSASKAARGIRSLAAPIAAELSPALGHMGSQMASVITTAAALGSGVGALAIGAATLAGIVGGKLVDAWQQSRAEFEKFGHAMASSDLPRVTAEVERLSTTIRGLSEELGQMTRGEKTTPLFEMLGERLGFGRRARLNEALDQSAQARAEQRRLRDLETGAPGMTLAEFNAILGSNAGTTFATQQGQRGLYDFTLPGPQATRASMLRQADDLEAAGQPEAAARLRAAASAQFGRTQDLAGARLFGRATPGAVSDYEGAFFGEAGQGAVRELLQQLDDRERQREIGLARNRGEILGAGAVSDYEGAFFGDEGQAKARQAIEALTTAELERQLSLTQQIATLNAAAIDVSLEQREALALQAIEREKNLKLALAGEDQAKRFGAEIEAQLKRQQLLEATDPVAGLKRGIASVEVEFGSAGLRMQSLMQNIGGGMAGALDETFFNVVTGKFKDLPSVAQRFGQDMVRAFTGELSKMATAAIFGQLRSSFESLFPGGGPAGSAPFGVGSVLTTAGRPLSESEIATAYAAGGDAGVRALRSGEATVVGGEFVATGGGLEQTTAGAGLRTTTAPSSFTVRQGLGIAGSAALLGLTAYGARGAQTNFDVGTSAALGALSGATLGGQVGGAFGYQGAGTAIGAVLGAAINGTIAALSKQEADKQRAKERQAAELERAAGAGSDLVRSAAGATSVSDLFRRITAAGSGYTGGTANPAVSTTVQTPFGPRPIGVENATYPVATLQDLLAAPETLRANIQAGVSPESLAGPNAATSTALQAIARDLVDQFRQAEQGVGLTQEDMLGGLTRRTTYPASRAGMLNPALDVSIDELALQALSDDDRAAVLLDVLGRVAQEQDIVSTISDGATGQIVPITRIARSTIPLPPSAAPGVSAGARAAFDAIMGLNIPRFTQPYPWQPVLGEQRYEYNASGEGGVYTEIPRQVLGYVNPSPEQLAAYEAQRAAFYAPYAQSLGEHAKTTLAALAPAEVQAAVTAGLLSPSLLASLIQAGLLPQITPLLSPELRGQIGELQVDAGGGVSVGLPAGTPAGAADFGSLPPGTFSEATYQALVAAVNSGSWGALPWAGMTPSSNLSNVQEGIAFLAGLGGMLVGIPGVGTLLSGIMAAINSVSYAVNAQNANYADAFVGPGQASPPATSDGLTFAQQLAFASQGVPFVSDPNSPTGYSIDPTFGYIDAQGMPQGYHTAGNPSGLPTNPDSTNFGGVPGNASGGVVGDGTGGTAPSDGGVQGP